ncbi:hypothetical protein DFH11DRAFT_1723805 [Phellopilus nigrolimitatus]|nr:hypothetical protein DFH11DRAFT_1723805 [Phellopilus nigrolimitatus]
MYSTFRHSYFLGIRPQTYSSAGRADTNVVQFPLSGSPPPGSFAMPESLTFEDVDFGDMLSDDDDFFQNGMAPASDSDSLTSTTMFLPSSAWEDNMMFSLSSSQTFKDPFEEFEKIEAVELGMTALEDVDSPAALGSPVAADMPMARAEPAEYDYQCTLASSAIDIAHIGTTSSEILSQTGAVQDDSLTNTPSQTGTVQDGLFTNTPSLFGLEPDYEVQDPCPSSPPLTKRTIPDPCGEIPEHLSQEDVERAEAILSELRTLTAARGLRGLGLINVPELTPMMTRATLVSAPVTPGRGYIAKTQSSKRKFSAIAPEPVTRLPKRMRVRLLVADVGDWVKEKVKKARPRGLKTRKQRSTKVGA